MITTPTGPFQSIENEAEAPATTQIGENFLLCNSTGFSFTESFRDADDSALGHEEGYIFSAWVRGDGEIIFEESGESAEADPDAWKRVEVQGHADNDGNVEITFRGSELMIDAVQLESRSTIQDERGNYFPTTVRRFCCPENACWDGNECFYTDEEIQEHGNPYDTFGHQMLNEPGFATNDGERGYICLSGGNFEFREKSYRWVEDTAYDLDDETMSKLQGDGEIFTTLESPHNNPHAHHPMHGFCEPEECFIGTHMSPISDTDGVSTSNIDRTDCIKGADSHQEIGPEHEFYGRYCVQGEWYRKTPHVGSLLLDLVDDHDTYSLYCGNYADVLNYYEYDFAGDDMTDYYNIFSQDIVPMLMESNEETLRPIKYLEKACVVKYGRGTSNTMVAIPLTADAAGTFADISNRDIHGINNIFDYDSGDLEIVSAFRYFGTEDGDQCADHAGSDVDDFIECTSGLFYNPRHNLIIYSHDTDMYSELRNLNELPIDNEPYLEHISAIEDIFDGEEEIRSENPEKFWALENHRSLDDVFIFRSVHQDIEMFVAREKLFDTTRVDDNRIKYFQAMRITGIEPNEEFLIDYSADHSPVNHTWSVSTADLFNYTGQTIVLDDDGMLNVLSSVQYGDSDFYRNWHKFTGRLRGDLELPPRD